MRRGDAKGGGLRKVILAQASAGGCTATPETPGTRPRRGSGVSGHNEGFDHMTVVVADLDDARSFFGLLGFVERIAVVASGEEIARYMGIPGWEADHVTLVLKGTHRCTRRSSCSSSITRRGHRHRSSGIVGAHGLQPRLLPGERPRRHAGAPVPARDLTTQRRDELPRPAPRVPRRAGCRRRLAAREARRGSHLA